MKIRKMIPSPAVLPILLILLLSLAGCGTGQASAPSPFDPAETLAALEEGGCFSQQLEELDGGALYRYYNLEDFQVEEEQLLPSAARRAGGNSCEEAAVLVFSTEKAAKNAQAALEEHLQLQIKANRDYRPEETPKLEAAVVVLRGNTLLLVVAHDADQVAGVIQEMK